MTCAFCPFWHDCEGGLLPTFGPYEMCGVAEAPFFYWQKKKERR